MTELFDVADNDGSEPSTESFDYPDRPAQIEAWKVPGAEGLPDDVKSTEIPHEGDDQ